MGLQPESRQQEEQNVQLHPLVLIPVHHHENGPHLSSPGRGTPARRRGAGRGAARGKPVGTVNPQPQSAQRKLGQAGFVQCGGSNARGAAQSSP